MTFNLRRHVPADGPNAWPHRRDAVAEVVLEQAPDVLATQEGTLPQLHDLDERLPGYERVGGARERWPGEEPNALYYDPERVRVLAAGEFGLSGRPLQPGRRSWGDWGRRTALWALLVLVETGAPLLVVNTHFDHVSALARRRSALLLRRVAPEAVLLGDFNAWPRRFVHSVLLDGRRDPLEGARHTHNVFTRRDRGRIDWILVPENWRVRKAAVLEPLRPDGGPVSDHLPVVVDADPPEVQDPVPVPGRTWRRDAPVPVALPPAPDQVAREARERAKRETWAQAEATAGSSAPRSYR